MLIIKYENGSIDVFEDAPQSSQTNNTYSTHNTFGKTNTLNNSNLDLAMQGKRDSQLNYIGRNSGAGWVAATNIILSPLFGLIPAFACSTIEPAEKNLNYMNTELMNMYDYNKAYTNEAHKTKKRKIWTSFGISSGALLLLILVL